MKDIKTKKITAPNLEELAYSILNVKDKTKYEISDLFGEVKKLYGDLGLDIPVLLIERKELREFTIRFCKSEKYRMIACVNEFPDDIIEWYVLGGIAKHYGDQLEDR
jgi:hypothetical protein